MEPRHPHAVYFGLLGGFTQSGVLLAVLLSGATSVPGVVAVSPAALFPASELAVAMTNFVACRLVPPTVLPRMDFRGGIPEDCATFVVIPTLISKPGQAAGLADRLEQHFLSNGDPRFRFALLTDFTDAPQESMPADDECVAALTAAAEKRLGDSVASFVRTMWPGLLVAAVAGGLVAWLAPAGLWAAGPVLLAWAVSPVVAYLVSRPRVVGDPPLTPAVEAELRSVARRTWDFFEAFVGPADHWLPPDNYQEAPLGVVAHRTSPTNIGLYLLAVLAARRVRHHPRRRGPAAKCVRHARQVAPAPRALPD